MIPTGENRLFRSFKKLVISVLLLLSMILFDFYYNKQAFEWSNAAANYVQNNWTNKIFHGFMVYATLYPYFAILLLYISYFYFKKKY